MKNILTQNYFIGCNYFLVLLTSICLISSAVAQPEHKKFHTDAVEFNDYHFNSVYKFNVGISYGVPFIGGILRNSSNKRYIIDSLVPKYPIQYGKSSLVGPISIKVEKAIGKYVGFQLVANYGFARTEFYYGYNTTGLKYKNTIDYHTISLIARINGHYSFNKKLDLYAGIGTGPRIGWNHIHFYSPSNSLKYTEIESKKAWTFIGFEMSGGVQYYFDKNWGMFIETGLTKSLIQLGVKYRF